MDENFVSSRISKLLTTKHISARKLSLNLGHSEGYINAIENGTSMPSLKELFAICDYLNITVAEFFDENLEYPELINKAVNGLKTLTDNDILLIINYIERLQK